MGEFSQGKSTLLNALLGEEIQPVRAIPCSGTVTTLRHGSRKQVICRYKDGRQEEISVDQYKEKASIPKAAAAGHYSDELATSELEDIIFEHPDLELCKSGVEILDSPGLNEHPDRTAITEKLLKDTDAALFLTNAARLLPEREKELIQAVRSQLSGDGGKSPAQNLFVLVNFMDLLDSDDDRQDVRERLETFIAAESLVVPDKNRVHYISAKAALKKQDGYLQAFREFTQAIEQFLTVERGSVEIQGVAKQLTTLTQRALLELNQVDTDINLSEVARQQILEQIGEASGRDVKIQIIADQMIEEAIEQVNQSFETWNAGLEETILADSQSWKSEHSHLWDQKRLIEDYANQFSAAVQQELEKWSTEDLKAKILSPALEALEKTIQDELAALQYNSSNLSGEINARFSSQLRLIIGDINDGVSGTRGFLGGGAVGVAVAAGLWMIPVVVALVPIVIAAVTAAVVGSFGLGLLDVDGIHDKIKAEVITKGFEQFDQSLEAICGQIGETIASVFQSRLDVADEAIRQIIASYENSLQVHEQASRSGIDKPWLAQQQQALQHLQEQAEAVVARSSAIQ